jgi:hypothetical protein
MSIDRVGNTFDKARNLQFLGLDSSSNFSDRIGGSDKNDFYRIRVAGSRSSRLKLDEDNYRISISISFQGAKKGINLSLFDEKRQGIVSLYEKAEKSKVTISEISFSSDTYYLRVYPKNGDQSITYNLLITSYRNGPSVGNQGVGVVYPPDEPFPPKFPVFFPKPSK